MFSTLVWETLVKKRIMRESGKVMCVSWYLGNSWINYHKHSYTHRPIHTRKHAHNQADKWLTLSVPTTSVTAASSWLSGKKHNDPNLNRRMIHKHSQLPRKIFQWVHLSGFTETADLFVAGNYCSSLMLKCNGLQSLFIWINNQVCIFIHHRELQCFCPHLSPVTKLPTKLSTWIN